MDDLTVSGGLRRPRRYALHAKNRGTRTSAEFRNWSVEPTTTSSRFRGTARSYYKLLRVCVDVLILRGQGRIAPLRAVGECDAQRNALRQAGTNWEYIGADRKPVFDLRMR